MIPDVGKSAGGDPEACLHGRTQQRTSEENQQNRRNRAKEAAVEANREANRRNEEAGNRERRRHASCQTICPAARWRKTATS